MDEENDIDSEEDESGEEERWNCVNFWKDYMKSFHIVVLYRLPSVCPAVWLNASWGWI